MDPCVVFHTHTCTSIATRFFSAVPEDFDYNYHTGKHGDRSHRVELKRSSVEYIAPSEYMVSNLN